RPFRPARSLRRVRGDPPPAFEDQTVCTQLPLVVNRMAQRLHAEPMVSHLVTAERRSLVGLEEGNGLAVAPALQYGSGGQVRDIADRGSRSMGHHLPKLGLD